MGIKLAIGEVSTGTVVEHFLKPNKVDRILAVDRYEFGGSDHAGRPWGYHFYFQFPSNFTTLKENDEVEFKITGLPTDNECYQCAIIKVLDEKRYDIPEWLHKGAVVYKYYLGLYTYKVLDVNHYSGKVLVIDNTPTKWTSKITYTIQELYETAEMAKEKFRELELD